VVEHLLDVSELEPCEPLEQTLAALPTLQAGDYLRVLHRREPFPLYELLQKQGFAWRSQGADSKFEIFIWRIDDAVAEAALTPLLIEV
jgi:uncharacterized protein (DUF2249 family)